MSKPTLVARDPAKVGRCEVGHFRVGVYTDRWEAALVARRDYREFTRRVPVEAGTYAVSGWPKVTWTSETIAGVLQLKGSTSYPFTVGLSMRLDGLFWTLDPMAHGYRVYDEVEALTYEVDGAPLVVEDPEVGGLAFRVCQVRLVEFP